MTFEVRVEQALAAMRNLLWKASSLVGEDFHYWSEHGKEPEYGNTQGVETAIETVFLQLLTLADSLGQPQLSEIIRATYQNAKRIGLGKTEQFEDQSAWPFWSAPLQRFIDAIEVVYGAKKTIDAVPTDLLTLLKNTQAAITDKRCFDPPRKEGEVQDRIEAILKCVYPDLIRKPPLAKPVVHFIPDCGIPSNSTLIEYKFMTHEEQAGTITNEILADTRGYDKSGWERIVFVIYETKRFNAPSEWQQMLVSNGLTSNVQLVVLHGEEPIQKLQPASANSASKTGTPKKHSSKTPKKRSSNIATNSVNDG